MPGLGCLCLWSCKWGFVALVCVCVWIHISKYFCFSIDAPSQFVRVAVLGYEFEICCGEMLAVEGAGLCAGAVGAGISSWDRALPVCLCLLLFGSS